MVVSSFPPRGLRPRTPYTCARGAPSPRSAHVAHSLVLVRSWGASPPNPLHVRSRGPIAPLRSRGSLASARSLLGSFAPEPPTRALAGPHRPAPPTWLTR